MTEHKPGYEVRHPDAWPPYPHFSTWGEALAAQKELNTECPGHKARKIPANEVPVDKACLTCGRLYPAWPDESDRDCFNCFSDKVEAADD